MPSQHAMVRDGQAHSPVIGQTDRAAGRFEPVRLGMRADESRHRGGKRNGPERKPGTVPSAPNALVQETVRAYYTSWYADVVTTLPSITDGQIAPPPGPGLGTRLRPDLLARADACIRTTTAADLD